MKPWIKGLCLTAAIILHTEASYGMIEFVSDSDDKDDYTFSTTRPKFTGKSPSNIDEELFYFTKDCQPTEENIKKWIEAHQDDDIPNITPNKQVTLKIVGALLEWPSVIIAFTGKNIGLSMLALNSANPALLTNVSPILSTFISIAFNATERFIDTGMLENARRSKEKLDKRRNHVKRYFEVNEYLVIEGLKKDLQKKETAFYDFVQVQKFQKMALFHTFPQPNSRQSFVKPKYMSEKTRLISDSVSTLKVVLNDDKQELLRAIPPSMDTASSSGSEDEVVTQIYPTDSTAYLVDDEVVIHIPSDDEKERTSHLETVSELEDEAVRVYLITHPNYDPPGREDNCWHYLSSFSGHIETTARWIQGPILGTISYTLVALNSLEAHYPGSVAGTDLQKMILSGMLIAVPNMQTMMAPVVRFCHTRKNQYEENRIKVCKKSLIDSGEALRFYHELQEKAAASFSTRDIIDFTKK